MLGPKYAQLSGTDLRLASQFHFCRSVASSTQVASRLTVLAAHGIGV